MTAQQFWQYVSVQPEGCWDWLGYKQPNGYGRLVVGKKGITAHRFAWELMRGEIPIGLCILHRCDNRQCVRPDHLFLGTKADNNHDMIAKGRDRHAQGERHGSAKLSTEDVRQIRQKSGKVPSCILAQEYRVSQAAISRIRRYKSWREVEP